MTDKSSGVQVITPGITLISVANGNGFTCFMCGPGPKHTDGVMLKFEGPHPENTENKPIFIPSCDWHFTKSVERHIRKFMERKREGKMKGLELKKAVG